MIERLKQLRRLWGWSQAYVANMLRVSRSSVSRWEREVGQPNDPNREKVEALVATLEKAQDEAQPGKPPKVQVFTHGDQVVRDKIIQGDAVGRDAITTGDGTTYLIRDSIVIVVADVEVVRRLLGEDAAPRESKKQITTPDDQDREN